MMVIQLFILFLQLTVGAPQDIPYRDEASYKLSLKMAFKVIPAPDKNKVDVSKIKTHNNDPQLYLNASLELLTLIDGDYRIKVTDSNNTLSISRKLKSPDIFLFRMGFASQMKDNTAPNVFTIQFLNKNKEVTGLIILEVKEDGDFIVNGKVFGKI